MHLPSMPVVLDSGHELCDANIDDVDVFENPYATYDPRQGSRDLGISDVCRSCVVDWLLDVANDVAWTPLRQVVYVARDGQQGHLRWEGVWYGYTLT